MNHPKPIARVRDPEYLKRVKTLPCCVRVLWWDFLPVPPPCDGVIEAAHVGARAKGRKSNDDEAIPLCTAHHMMLDNCIGGSLFLGLQEYQHPEVAKANKRAWVSSMVNLTQTTICQREELDQLLAHGGIPF